MNSSLIRFSLDGRVSAELQIAAASAGVRPSKLCAQIIAAAFAHAPPRSMPDAIRAAPKVIERDGRYYPPAIGAEVADDDIVAMITHGFSVSYIVGRYRLTWKRVQGLADQHRASSNKGSDSQ